MANVKISDLTAASAAAGANEYEINEAGTSKKVTGTQISAFVKADLLDDTTVNFTGTLQNGGSNVVVDSDIGSTVQGYDANTVKLNVAQTFTATQTFSTVSLGNWTITESAGVLYFATGGTNRMKIDASGNLTVTGDVTAYGTV